MLSSKYLDIDTTNGRRMRCRICRVEVYATPAQPSVDPEGIEAVLDHFEIAHDVSYEDLSSDLENTFDGGIRKEEKKRIKE